MTHHPDFHTRRAFFDGYEKKMIAGRRDLSPVLPAPYYTCPCCGYPMLSSRGDFEICLLCWWEDDGLDDEQGYPGDLDRESGPNHMTLREARRNFEEHLHSTGTGGNIVAGMNDEKALENNRRIVAAFDALLGASETQEILDLFSVVDEALLDNARVLMQHPGLRRRNP